MVTLETQEILMDLRLRSIKKEAITDEELKRAIDLLRDGRYAALTETPSRKSKTTKTTKMTDSELEALFDG